MAFQEAVSNYVKTRSASVQMPDPVVPPHAPAQSQAAGPGSKIIMLGDSGAEYACTDIARFCGKSKVVNMGASGSTAASWAAGSCPDDSLVLLQSSPPSFS